MPELENLNCNWKIPGGSLYTNMEGKNSGGTQFIRVYPTLWWFLPPSDISALDMNEKKLIHTVFKVEENVAFWNTHIDFRPLSSFHQQNCLIDA